MTKIISQLPSLKEGSDPCSICYEPFTDDPNNPPMVHDDHMHPNHLKCMQAWAKVQENADHYTCPQCRTEIDMEPHLRNPRIITPSAKKFLKNSLFIMGCQGAVLVPIVILANVTAPGLAAVLIPPTFASVAVFGLAFGAIVTYCRE